MENEVTFLLRMPKKLKDLLQEHAEKDLRSLNSEIIFILDSFLQSYDEEQHRLQHESDLEAALDSLEEKKQSAR